MHHGRKSLTHQQLRQRRRKQKRKAGGQQQVDRSSKNAPAFAVLKV